MIKSFIKDKEVASIKIDPMKETADINEKNNSWNTMPEPSRFTIFKQAQTGGRRNQGGQSGNPMQRAQEKKGFWSQYFSFLKPPVSPEVFYW